MARFKVPKTLIYGALPKTSTGKIQKFALREKVKAL
jgi:fatty-acyl-CoA synthase